MFINSFIPSQRTLILIAGSEISERALSHERVQSVLDPSVELLQKWIEKETVRIKNDIENYERLKLDENT